MIKNIGIRPKLLFTTAIVLITGMIVVMAWSGYTFFLSTRNSEVQQVITLSDSISQFVYVFMNTGQQEALDGYLDQVGKLRSVKEIHISKSSALEKELGAKKGDVLKNALEEQVLSSGHEIINDTKISGERVIERVVPVTASKSCLNCHTSFKEGDVMASLSTVISYQSSFEEIMRNLWKMGVIQFLNILLVILLIYFLTGKLVLKALFRVVGGLNDSVGQTSAVAEHVSSMAQVTSQGASEQASSLEETSSALDEMTSMIKQNADNAALASQMALETKLHAEKGDASMKDMQSSMKAMAESADKAGRIVKSIEEIAFQTNILALNAAVEAARAGEYGKGFAVVADEVRSLAQSASLAAKDTQALIEDSQSRTREGAQITKRTGEALQQIVEAAQKVAATINEIALASKEQAEGINQITHAITQMDQITQHNAATAQESATASEELLNQAEDLKKMVLALEQIVSGSSVLVERSAELPFVKPSETTALNVLNEGE